MYNIPVQANDDRNAGCTIHVFWQAPDENRLVTAWYGRGTRVLDFSNPERPRELAWFIPTDAETWSAKPHNGYIYAGDTVRGLDVFRYTGEGWPATSGAAEIQRARQQGASADKGTISTTQQPGARRSNIGRESFVTYVRVPKAKRKKVLLTTSFYDKKGNLVQRLRSRAKSGSTKRLRMTVAGLAGRYRYTVRRGNGGKLLRRSSFRVRADENTRVQLREGETLVCQIR